MKARVKATGKIVEVTRDLDLRNSTVVAIYTNIEDPSDVFDIEELEFIGDYTPYYWTRLEHQYAGMAMQGLVTRGEVLGSSVQEIARDIAEIFCEVAHALVEKMKEERK